MHYSIRSPTVPPSTSTASALRPAYGPWVIERVVIDRGIFPCVVCVTRSLFTRGFIGAAAFDPSEKPWHAIQCHGLSAVLCDKPVGVCVYV